MRPLTRPSNRILATAAAGTLLALLAGCGSRRSPTGPPPAAIPATRPPQSDAEALLRRAEALRRAGRSREALELAAPAYKQRPRDPRFSAALADLLLANGHLPQAETLAERERRAFPRSGELAAAAAEAALSRGRYETALRRAELAVRLAADSAPAWRALAHACAVNKLLGRVWRAYDRARELAPDDGTLLADYGETLARYGRAEEAESALRQAAARMPEDPRTLGQLGSLLGDRAETPARRAEAGALLRRTIELAPHGTEAPYRLGRLLLKGGDAVGAIAVLEPLDKRTLPEVWLPLAQAYQAANRAGDAGFAFREYRRYTDYRRRAAQLTLRLRRQPGSPALLREMAALQEAYGRSDLAARYTAQADRADSGTR